MASRGNQPTVLDLQEALERAPEATPLLPLQEVRDTPLRKEAGGKETNVIRERKTANVLEFESTYRQPVEREDSLPCILKKTGVNKWAKFSFKRVLLKNLPILRTIRHYNVRADLPKDVIAGLTSGVMMIPQGMAFASLSTLPPIVGLYISLFSSVTYFFLGTGHQLSWGCIAVLSIMMGAILDKYDRKMLGSLEPDQCMGSLTTLASVLANSTRSDVPVAMSTDTETLAMNATTWAPEETTFPEELSVAKRLEVVGSVTLICGMILVALGKLGLGKVTVFMSDSFITSFMVGVAFHVASTQLKTVFGLSLLPRVSGIFKLVRLWVLVLSHIHHSNLATVITSALCIASLYLVKRFINEKYHHKLPMPVPIELLVAVMATVIFSQTSLSQDYKIGIVKEVPVGLPKPRIPDLRLGADYIADGLIVVIISFAQTVALGKTMGLKHHYKVDADQEMFACGIVNVVCSIFSGYICSASVSRSVVQDGAGGRTQLASLVAAVLVLLVILWLGPYFYYLPNAALAAIILVNLQSMFLKLMTLPDLWRKSRVDFLVWVVTFASVVILDVDYGLLVGLVASVLIVLVRSQVASVDVVAQISAGEGSAVWRSRDKYFGGREFGNIKVVRINAPIYFANSEIVTSLVFKKSGVVPAKLRKVRTLVIKLEKKQDTQVSIVKGGEAADTDQVVVTRNRRGDVPSGKELCEESSLVNPEQLDVEKVGASQDGSLATAQQNGTGSTRLPADEDGDEAAVSSLILDLSGASFLDLMGVKAVEFMISEYKTVDVHLYVSNVQEKCLDTLQRTGFMNKHGDRVFLTTEAALASILGGGQN